LPLVRRRFSHVGRNKESPHCERRKQVFPPLRYYASYMRDINSKRKAADFSTAFLEPRRLRRWRP
jgi:hypothetical protein